MIQKERENIISLYNDETINFHQIVYLSILFLLLLSLSPRYFLSRVSVERAETIVPCFAAVSFALLTHYYSLSIIIIIIIPSFFGYCYSYKMLMKLLVSVFERARSKLTVTRSNNRIPSGLLNILNDITIGFFFFCS